MKISKELLIAILAIVGIAVHLFFRFSSGSTAAQLDYPLLCVLIFGGIPLVWELLAKLFRLQFGSDLLAGISIVTSVLLDEYLAGSLVVLMLSGGEALEEFAVGKASRVLAALAKRMPQKAHIKIEGGLKEVPVSEVKPGDMIVVMPHEIVPVDGTVLEGRTVMDESFLTGEPFKISKIPGAKVISGAVNSENAVTVRADKLALDSRYARIMRVMEESEQTRPQMRRLGDRLGAFYTPLAVAIALAAWFISGDSHRFLSVLVVATPCPLLIAIPVAIIGTISLAASRGIIVRNPAALEEVGACKGIIFDKTGTLTYGRPEVTRVHTAPGFTEEKILALAAGLEMYSRHPLASAVTDAALKRGVIPAELQSISELPGRGLSGAFDGHLVTITGRAAMKRAGHPDADILPPAESGLECVVLCDDKFAALLRFHDSPRPDSRPFIDHLDRKHKFEAVVLLSGDRESEVRYFADLVGIKTVYAEKQPEEKLDIVRDFSKKLPLIYVGDGINDAPALAQARVGIALGQENEITTEAASVVIMDPSLSRIDEFFHIGQRMRSIALQSAIGGMALSIVGMFLAAGGFLAPVAGALTQEFIDLAAVLNALRSAFEPRVLVDYEIA